MSTVSALVSAYYAAEYLEGRLDNLLQQRLQPEIVVVCQVASREEAIAKRYLAAGRDNLTIVHTLDVPTIYAAWNMATAVAKGEYLTNANCDDRLYEGGLEALAQILDERSDVAVAYGDQEIVKKIGAKPTDKFVWKEGGFDDLMNGCFLGPMPMWRRGLHHKYGGFDETLRVAGDYDFWLRLAAGGEKFFHFRGVVGQYLQRENSAERRKLWRTLWETARVRSRYRKEEICA